MYSFTSVVKRYVCGEKKQIVLVVKKKQLNAEYGSFPREVDSSNEALERRL